MKDIEVNDVITCPTCMKVQKDQNDDLNFDGERICDGCGQKFHFAMKITYQTSPEN